MQSHIGCICSTFPHCAFSNVSSNCFHERMQSRIGCICLTLLHCEFSNVSSNRLHETTTLKIYFANWIEIQISVSEMCWKLVMPNQSKYHIIGNDKSYSCQKSYLHFLLCRVSWNLVSKHLRQRAQEKVTALTKAWFFSRCFFKEASCL